MRPRAWQALVVTIAAIVAVVPIPATWVERWFSLTWYPPVQRGMTTLSNAVPVALFDLLVVAATVLAGVAIIRGVRAAWRVRKLTPLVVALGRIAVAAAIAYLAFLATWGMNYRRLPMSARLELANAPPTTEAVVALGLDAIRRMNHLHDGAHRVLTAGQDPANAALREAFAQVQRALSDAPLAVPGRLKPTIFGPYFRWTGVDGMVDPYALEVLTNPDLLPWERPFVAAHEWAHLAGYADEQDANLVGWLTAIRADAAAQYSGWMYLYFQVSGELGASERARLAAAVDPGPRRDIEQIADRIRRGQLPQLRVASWFVYDQYLKANRVEEGVRAYGAVVTLILRARFADDWVPVRRGAATPGRGSGSLLPAGRG